MNKIQSKIVKTILIITAVMLMVGCATPTECYGDTLTIYSVSPESELQMEINKANYNIQAGKDIMYMSLSYMTIMQFSSMLAPVSIGDPMFIPMERMRAGSMIVGASAALLGQFIIMKNKKKKKRLAQLK